MKYLCLLFFILCGCSTLNKTAIENANRSTFQPLVLNPEYDFYEIRIDLIRQTNEERVNDSTFKKEEKPYHTVGFYLGNGLFLDLNDNLSFLVPKLLDINCNNNFSIIESYPDYIFKSTTNYEKADSLFITKHKGLIKTNTKKIITKKDSVVYIKEGIFSKSKIVESDSSILYQSGLAKTAIHKNNEGYFYKTLFWKKEYKLINNEILIGNRYILRNRGDIIEIVAHGLFNREYLKYRIIKSDNKIYVYVRNYRGLEIIRTENKITVMENTRILKSYSIE